MKIYHDAQIEAQLKDAHERLDDNIEKALGIGLNQPNEPLNSSSRKIMHAIQSTHRVNLNHPELPFIETGYESKFGKYSSSILKSECDWRVIAKIEKYERNPGVHYYLIVINERNEMDIIERISYYHSTETYGYLYDNHFLDHVNVGDTISKDSILRTSNAFDKYGNHMKGTNLNCCYMALDINTEDPVIISESAAKKLESGMIKKVEIIINDNDIPLNLYGDSNNYKIFPDIGEEIKNGVIAGIRKENKDETFFTQSIERLSNPMINDITYKLSGIVLDINVYSNKQIKEGESEDDLYNCYEGQLKYYIDEDKRFCRELIECMRNYIDNSNYKKSYNLSKMYHICEQKLNGVQYIKENKVFSNIHVEIYVYETNKVSTGDKVSNRYGGKGVISRILPDELMPRMEGSDKPADLIWNQATCVNRLNNAQLIESSLNYISKHLLMYMDSHLLHADECLNLLVDYYKAISDDFGDYLINYLETNCDDEDLEMLIGSLITENEDGIYLSIKPISECVDFDKLRKIYDKFSWIHPKELLVPIKGSNGKYRYIKSNKKSILSSQYIYRMKQCAEEKHSANSLSSTNIRNENSKSRASKLYMQVNSSTPIRMGEMESNILIHLGPEIYVTNLMLYSTSPQGRRNAGQLLSGDPYNIDIHLNDDDKSRSVEKFNASLKTMGLRLRFTKILKKRISPFIKYVKGRSPFQKVVRSGSPFQKVVERKSPFEKIRRDD